MPSSCHSAHFSVNINVKVDTEWLEDSLIHFRKGFKLQFHLKPLPCNTCQVSPPPQSKANAQKRPVYLMSTFNPILT